MSKRTLEQNEAFVLEAGSTMAYCEARPPSSPIALFLHARSR